MGDPQAEDGIDFAAAELLNRAGDWSRDFARLEFAIHRGERDGLAAAAALAQSRAEELAAAAAELKRRAG